MFVAIRPGKTEVWWFDDVYKAPTPSTTPTRAGMLDDTRQFGGQCSGVEAAMKGSVPVW